MWYIAASLLNFLDSRSSAPFGWMIYLYAWSLKGATLLTFQDSCPLKEINLWPWQWRWEMPYMHNWTPGWTLQHLTDQLLPPESLNLPHWWSDHIQPVTHTGQHHQPTEDPQAKLNHLEINHVANQKGR